MIFFLKKRLGFTLIEIIIVVIMIGVLSSLALTRHQKTIRAVVERQTVLQLKGIYLANSLYFSRAGRFLPAAGLNAAEISSQLGIDVQDGGGMAFLYHQDAYDQYHVFAAYSEGATEIFKICMTENNFNFARMENNFLEDFFVTDAHAIFVVEPEYVHPTSDLNPCCYSGVCPTAASCW